MSSGERGAWSSPADSETGDSVTYMAVSFSVYGPVPLMNSFGHLIQPSSRCRGLCFQGHILPILFLNNSRDSTIAYLRRLSWCSAILCSTKPLLSSAALPLSKSPPASHSGVTKAAPCGPHMWTMSSQAFAQCPPSLCSLALKECVTTSVLPHHPSSSVHKMAEFREDASIANHFYKLLFLFLKPK